MPGQYFVGLREQGTLSLLAEEYPALSEATLPRKRSLEISARDGRRLPVLLSLPPGAESAKGLSAVLLPHGGPIAMDSNDFDPLVQFLADRGYAVLQVNFRGSSGYGHAHMSAGLKRWGLEMRRPETAQRPLRGLRAAGAPGRAGAAGRAGRLPVSRGGRPVCWVRMRPLTGAAGAAGFMLFDGVELLRRALW